jgi:hypothetical protein
VRVKPLLVNRYEKAAFGEIQRVVDDLGLTVWMKVGMKDVLPIEGSGLSDAHYRYALMAHFDFVICRDMIPEYAVEFDGPSHRSARAVANDAKKNAICDRFEFPLLRIDSRHIELKYGPLTLLGWILEVRETEIAFDDAQRKGLVPYDEPFDPIAIWTIGNRHRPFELARSARLHWDDLATRRVLYDRISSGGHWYDDANVMYGIEFIRVTPTHGLHVATWMRLQNFPEMITLFEEILCVRLDEKIDLYLNGAQPLEPLTHIDRKIRRFNATYKRGGCHSFCRPGTDLMDMTVSFGRSDLMPGA